MRALIGIIAGAIALGVFVAGGVGAALFALSGYDTLPCGRGGQTRFSPHPSHVPTPQETCGAIDDLGRRWAKTGKPGACPGDLSARLDLEQSETGTFLDGFGRRVNATQNWPSVRIGVRVPIDPSDVEPSKRRTLSLVRHEFAHQCLRANGLDPDAAHSDHVFWTAVDGG